MEVEIDREAIRKVIMDLPKLHPVRMNYLANRSINRWWVEQNTFNYTPTISADVGLKR